MPLAITSPPLRRSKMCAASFPKMATSNSVNANYIGLHTLVASVFSQNEELAELLQVGSLLHRATPCQLFANVNSC